VETISHLFSSLRASPKATPESETDTARRDEVIERLARAVVARRLEAPATLFLELNRPLGFLFSQATFFARPFLSFFLPVRDIEAAAGVLGDPAALDRLMNRMDALSAEGAVE
jgi:hypothetical protein